MKDAEFNVASAGARTRWIAAAVVATLLLGLGHALEGVIPVPFAMLVFLLGLGIGGGIIASMVRAQRFERGPMVVDKEGVRLGEHVIPRATIKAAWFAPGAGRIRSSLRLAGDNDRELARLAVNSEEADTILDALELGPKQRAARFPAFAPKGSTAANASLGMFALGLLPMVGMFLFNAPLLVAVSLLLWVLGSAVFLPCTVHVGADGILIATRVAPTFIPWSDVVAVEPADRGISIRRRNDVVMVPLTPPGRFVSDYNRVLHKGVLDRAAKSLAAYRQGAHPDAEARVARRGRPHAEWLRDLFDREGSFRTAPLLDDQLWNVVESPTAEPTARAGAAAVLARGAGDAERIRIRVAAESCTAPHLRVALEKAADGASEAEVEEALLALEDGTERSALRN